MFQKKKNSSLLKGWYHENFIKFIDKKINLETKIISKDVFIDLIGNIDFSLDKKNKSLRLIKKDFSGRAIIYGGQLNNWSISFFDETKFINVDSNLYGLTGCLTIVDVSIEKLSINMTNSKCEDAVNFIRANGSVNNLRITNSESDSLDSDFSNLTFNHIKVDGSKNDCLDFSYGKYSILEANVSNCGDKGVSVGENSELKINNIGVFNSITGVASKDYSSVYIDEIIIDKTNNCIQLYNKKDEFSGGKIDIKKIRCTRFEKKFDVGLNSLLKVNHEF